MDSVSMMFWHMKVMNTILWCTFLLSNLSLKLSDGHGHPKPLASHSNVHKRPITCLEFLEDRYDVSYTLDHNSNKYCNLIGWWQGYKSNISLQVCGLRIPIQNYMIKTCFTWFRRPQDSDRNLASLGILYRVLQSPKSHIHLLNSIY